MPLKKALWAMCKVQGTNGNNGLKSLYRFLLIALIAGPSEERLTNRFHGILNFLLEMKFLKCLHKSSPVACPKRKLAMYFVKKEVQ